jgi:hypothetical protein
MPPEEICQKGITQQGLSPDFSQSTKKDSLHKISCNTVGLLIMLCYKFEDTQQMVKVEGNKNKDKTY